MLRVVYIALALLVIGGYAYAGRRGMEISLAQKSKVEPGMRGRGGTGVFWYGGYRGGK